LFLRGARLRRAISSTFSTCRFNYRKGLLEIARELAMLGRTKGARRKLIARALRVASICPEAKKAAIEAGLGIDQ
jgi:hypothetical protein